MSDLHCACGEDAESVCLQCGTPFCMRCYWRYEVRESSLLCWQCQNSADKAWLALGMPAGGPRRVAPIVVAHPVILTIGYSGWKPAALAHAVQSRGATLWDIRFRAWSRAPQWRPDALRALLGASYVQMPALGNPNYRNGGLMTLHAPLAALRPAHTAMQRGPLVLLCGCKAHEECHRTLAAAWMAERFANPTVTHLYPERV